MVIAQIYYDGSNVNLRRLCADPDFDLKYRISGNTVRAYWHRRSCNKVNLQPHEVYTVIINRSGLPEIKHDLPPKDPRDSLMWVFGFTDTIRTQHRTTFDERLCRFHIDLGIDGASEFHLSGPYYEFVYYQHQPHQISPLAAYLDFNSPLDITLIKDVLTAFTDLTSARATSPDSAFIPLPYPYPFVQKILSRHLHMNNSDWQAIQLTYAHLFPAFSPAP